MKTRKIYDDRLMIKLPKELKDKLEQEANSKYKSISEYIRDLINKELEEK